MADLTLVNLNMLYMRTVDSVEREIHLPLGPLYLTSALEAAGLAVDFRDYQTHTCDDPFDAATMAAFLADPAPVLGVSCMANLLPFALLALREFKERHPEVKVVLGGVGPYTVERPLLERFDWIDVIVRGEAERTLPELIAALGTGGRLDDVRGIAFREDHRVVETAPRPRIRDLDAVPRPAYHHVDLSRYNGYGVITSRGCPYACSFCSVAPIWGHPCFRSPADIVAEMRSLHEAAGVNLFLFQDEFFVASRKRVRAFCRELRRASLPVQWKSFARVNLTDRRTLQAMVESGCVEVRYGVESGSDRVLRQTCKGFRATDPIPVIARALKVIPQVDAFYMWGFPFEEEEDFRQSLFQMLSLRMMGARVLPSLLCWLPQTDLYREWLPRLRLEFCPELLPEYMVTGHELRLSLRVEIDPRHRPIFDFISQHPDLFPGFFHHDLEGNILPKLHVLQQFGFYPRDREQPAETESCGAHSPRVAQRQTRGISTFITGARPADPS